ncbi:NERD domain-containing protein [Streptomyces sp. 8K308]|uniref:nuclease-related domain-containing protein n=1 Tax=Streptomyces sp. 8K308 TaxID=2530388 RepID=UPI0010429E0B|nr:nuclease-related domain-containing protein [Streptomyces sp. 8K308]TDC20142.1 NERD domain-containing protein [Streptomyces sp. 8K308]
MGGWEHGNGIPPDPGGGALRGSGPLWLHPDDDLAPNRPGEILHGLVATLPAGRVRLAADRLLGRSARREALLTALRGEQLAGTALDALAGAGWRVLHSIPLPGAADISHLAIGPGGVLSFRTVLHRGARLAVEEELVRIGTRRAEPHVRRCRRDAHRAAHALSAACGFRVAVQPVLVCVAAASVTVAPGLRDVEVLQEHALAGLAGRGGVLRPDGVETLYGLARDRRTWLRG